VIRYHREKIKIIYLYQEEIPMKPKVDKQLVLRALTDAKFRKMLQVSPLEAIELAQIKGGMIEVSALLAMVGAINQQISHVGDELLCVVVDKCQRYGILA